LEDAEIVLWVVFVGETLSEALRILLWSVVEKGLKA